MAQAGKLAEVYFEQMLETYEHQTMLVDKTMVFKPESGDMQNAGNVVWRPVQQHRPILQGWDLTGQEQDIIEETYPAFLGTPNNDLVQQRIDNLRDMTFWERAGKQSGRQQATQLNKDIADLIKNSGSLFYQSNPTNGFEFISEAQAIMNERQGAHTKRCYILNDRTTQSYASELSTRQTVKGRPEEAWKTGQIGSNVAEFDVYTGSFIGNLVGGANPATTTTAALSFVPEGGSVDPTTFVVTNVDYRTADIPVVDSTAYNVGDKVTISNAGTPIESVGL
ncbi:hypothetical protein KAR91_53685, partial [Candidatus Pacearchaeota archaeon]|nr:hypothetical protein [Candidatus Pacearchaeota archaeon]